MIKKSDNYTFIIETLSQKPIGTVSIFDVNKRKKSAEYGRMVIGDINYRMKGHALDATNAILIFAFNNLKLVRVKLGVLKNNKPAVNLYKNIGFSIVKSKGNNSKISRITMFINKGIFMKQTGRRKAS